MEANNKTYEVSTVLVSLFIDVGEGAPTGYTLTHENGLAILVRLDGHSGWAARGSENPWATHERLVSVTDSHIE